MATRHMTREVRIFGLYHDAVRGTHFSIVKSGRWNEVLAYLNIRSRHVGPGNLFIENSDGKLVPLMG